MLFLRKIILVFMCAVTVCVFSSDFGFCQGFWGRKQAASSEESYMLTKQHGPWLIMAMVFADENPDVAYERAKTLVQELRQNRMNAYIYFRVHEDSDSTEGLPYWEYDKESGELKISTKCRYLNKKNLTEYAVLVGNYSNLDDKSAAKTLERIHKMTPTCLQKGGMSEATHPLFSTPESNRQTRTPMQNAFMTPNPLLPKELFVSRGLDKTVLNANKDIKKYSLLDCPGMYSVQVAVLKGVSTLNQQKILEIMSSDEKMVDSKQTLAEADENALKLCNALRKKGYEAYVFRDHYASIVTIGSFNKVGDWENGEFVVDPEIQKIFEVFSATANPNPGMSGVVRKSLKEVKGVLFDITPKVIVVPRRPVVNTGGRFASW
ncbi:MAG: hypothetical protein Q4C96_01930 [Planctomycetia bacterium]|nr:hypothetical protein [Planctomycetia bacterium]